MSNDVNDIYAILCIYGKTFFFIYFFFIFYFFFLLQHEEHYFTKQDEHYLQYHLQDVTYSTYYIILP